MGAVLYTLPSSATPCWWLPWVSLRGRGRRLKPRRRRTTMVAAGVLRSVPDSPALQLAYFPLVAVPWMLVFPRWVGFPSTRCITSFLNYFPGRYQRGPCASMGFVAPFPSPPTQTPRRGRHPSCRRVLGRCSVAGYQAPPPLTLTRLFQILGGTHLLPRSPCCLLGTDQAAG